jgi:hypothetical protein
MACGALPYALPYLFPVCDALPYYETSPAMALQHVRNPSLRGFLSYGILENVVAHVQNQNYIQENTNVDASGIIF